MVPRGEDFTGRGLEGGSENIRPGARARAQSCFFETRGAACEEEVRADGELRLLLLVIVLVLLAAEVIALLS